VVRATHSAITSSKSVFEKGPDGLNQTITARQSGPPTTDGIVGMTKVWDSSASIPFFKFEKSGTGQVVFGGGTPNTT
jgi:hypothetical protein